MYHRFVPQQSNYFYPAITIRSHILTEIICLKQPQYMNPMWSCDSDLGISAPEGLKDIVH